MNLDPDTLQKFVANGQAAQKAVDEKLRAFKQPARDEMLGDDLTPEQVGEILLLQTNLSKETVVKIVEDLHRVERGETPLVLKFEQSEV